MFGFDSVSLFVLVAPNEKMVEILMRTTSEAVAKISKVCYRILLSTFTGK